MLLAAFCIAAITPDLDVEAYSAGANFNQGALDPVRFFVVDDTPDASVDLTPASIYTGEKTLQYKVGSGSRENYISGPITISTGGNYGHEIVYMQLVGGNQTDTNADLLLTSWEKSANGLDLFSGLIINWGNGFNITFNTVSGNDNLAPVPIPGAAFLPGSGILCLVGFIRKRS